jgi:hypothetical protein
VCHDVDQAAISGDESSDAGEGLAHRSHDEVDLPEEVEMLRGSAPPFAEDSQRVRFVDHQQGTVRVRDLRSPRR